MQPSIWRVWAAEQSELTGQLFCTELAEEAAAAWGRLHVEDLEEVLVRLELSACPVRRFMIVPYEDEIVAIDIMPVNMSPADYRQFCRASMGLEPEQELWQLPAKSRSAELRSEAERCRMEARSLLEQAFIRSRTLLAAANKCEVEAAKFQVTNSHVT